MFKDAQDFLDRRTVDAEVDMAQYTSLLRWLTFVSMRGEHSTVFARNHAPEFTWSKRRNGDDVVLGTNSFPVHPERGSTHIQLFAEGHPVYSPLGVTAIVGVRDEDGALPLCILSTDGEKAWANMYRGGDPIGAEAFESLVANFQDVQF